MSTTIRVMQSTRAVRALCAVGASVVVVSTACSAYAQGDSGTAAAAAAESRGRYKEGVQLTHQRKYELARAKFVEAIALDANDAEAILSLAVVETDLGHPVAAYVALRRYLRHPKADAATAAKAKARMVPALEAKVGQIAVTAAPGAEVTVDGVSAGRAPLEETVVVAPGAHVVAVGGAGAGGASQSVDVGTGGSVAVTLVAAVEPAVAPVVPVVTDVHAGAGAGAALPASEAGGGGGGGGWSGAKIGTVAGLGALAVTGIVIGVLESSARSSRDDDAKALGAPPPNCPANPGSASCAKLADLKSSYDSDQKLATAFIVSGAVLAAGAAAAAIFWPSKSGGEPVQAGLHVAPMVGVSAGGIQLSASF